MATVAIAIVIRLEETSVIFSLFSGHLYAIKVIQGLTKVISAYGGAIHSVGVHGHAAVGAVADCGIHHWVVSLRAFFRAFLAFLIAFLVSLSQCNSLTAWPRMYAQTQCAPIRLRWYTPQSSTYA
ncbi:hypothetical protein D3C72_430720 [compost metagenome]